MKAMNKITRNIISKKMKNPNETNENNNKNNDKKQQPAPAAKKFKKA